MALNTQEQQIAQFGVKNGKTEPEILQAISKYRSSLDGSGKTGLTGFGVGVGKSVAETARGAAGLVQGLGQRVLAGVTPGQSVQDIKGRTGIDVLSDQTQAGQRAAETLTPRGTSERAGFRTSEFAQFLIPSTKISKGAKAAQSAVRAKTGSKAAGFGAKAITEGAGFAGITAAQEGDLNKEVGEAGIIGAAFPVLGKGFQTLKGTKRVQKMAEVFKGDNAAGKIINTLLKPTKTQFAYGKNPGKAVASEGIVAKNFDELEIAISKALNTRNTQLTKKVAASKERFDFTNAFSPLDDAIEQAAAQNNQAMINRLGEIKQALTQKLAPSTKDGVTSITSKGIRNIKDMSAEAAVNLKREVGRLSKWTGNPSDDKLVNATLQKIYRKMDTLIVEKIPGVGTLNERVSSLISAEAAAKNRAVISERQNFFGFAEKLTGVGGVVTSVVTGNITPLIVTAGASGLSKAMRSPEFQTKFASWLATASSAKKKELIKKAPFVKAAILEVIVNN